MIDRSLSSEIESLWLEAHGQDVGIVEQCVLWLRGISLFLHATARRHLEESREQERRLRRGLRSIQHLQELRLHDAELEEKLSLARQEIREVEEHRHDFFFHSQAAQWWTQVGDRVTGEFFEVVGPRHRRAGVRQLKKPDGTLAVEPDEMREVATDFYRDLLTVDPPPESLDACRDQVWGHVQRRVSDDMRQTLVQQIQVTELWDALRALPRASCPGVDGLAPGFFLTFWDLLGDDLCACMQQIVDIGRCLRRSQRGLFTSSPRGGGVG